MKLGFKKCVDIMIGMLGKIKGIFGGEMKRLLFVFEVKWILVGYFNFEFLNIYYIVFLYIY